MDALIRIQKELKVKKERWNEFGKFPYRNAEDILKAAKPLLQEGEQLKLSEEVILVGDRYYFKAKATLIGADKEEASEYAFAREPEKLAGMNSAQISGAASSYAAKYALGKLFLLDDGLDADHPLPPEDNAPSNAGDWFSTTGPDQKPEPNQPAPEQQPAPATPPAGKTLVGYTTGSGASPQAPATPPAGKTLVATPEQRPWVISLWEFYLTQAKGRPMNKKGMHKMMALCMMHMQRYPGSMSDVDLCKRYIKVEELIG